MPDAPLTDEAERAAVAHSIDAFVEEWAPSGHLLGVEHLVVTDGSASDRWVLRFKGTEKDVIAIWLTLGQRTVVAETEVMPAPDADEAGIHAIVLRRNAQLLGLAYALGAERGIYLVSRVPAVAFDRAELDRVCGAAIGEVEAVFATVMAMGFPGRWRRRPR